MIRAAVCLAAAFVGLSITLSLAGPAQADDYRRLSGAEIKRLIAGKAVTDEVHYMDHFGVNGVYEGVFMNKRSTGTWKVKGNQLCIIRHRKRKTATSFGGRVRSSSAARPACRL